MEATKKQWNYSTKKGSEENIDSESHSKPIIDATNLSKIYSNGYDTIALNKVNLAIFDKKFVAIYGSSGCGKSTLLHLLAGIDKVTKLKRTNNQKLEVNGVSLLDRSESFLAGFRASNIGFVLQFFGLLPTLTALENVMIAAYFGRKKGKRNLAMDTLKAVGLKDRMHHYPNQLSGGQKQRVAIARALVNKPTILFADEPTGNLDSKSGEEILELLKKLNDEGLTIVMVTHDKSVFDYATRRIQLQDGTIVSDDLINT